MVINPKIKYTSVENAIYINSIIKERKHREKPNKSSSVKNLVKFYIFSDYCYLKSLFENKFISDNGQVWWKHIPV